MQLTAYLALVGSANAFTMMPAVRTNQMVRSTDSVTMMAGAGPDPQQKNVKIPTKQEWVAFAKASDCKPGTIISGFRKGQEIAIITTEKGKLYACSNRLPPVGQPATTAGLFDDVIVEPITATAFNLKNGKVEGTWCPSPIGKLVFSWLVAPNDAIMFPVKKSGNDIQVRIDVNAKAKFEQKYWRGVLDAQGKVDGGYY